VCMCMCVYTLTYCSHKGQNRHTRWSLRQSPQHPPPLLLHYVLQSIAVCCSVLQCFSVLQCIHVGHYDCHPNTLLLFFCSVCCSVLQCFSVSHRHTVYSLPFPFISLATTIICITTARPHIYTLSLARTHAHNHTHAYM